MKKLFKVLISLSFLLVMLTVATAISYKTTYNPFTSKLDYVWNGVLTGLNGSSLNVNSSVYWDNLNTPSDLNNLITSNCNNITGSSGSLCNNQTADANTYADTLLTTTFYNASSINVATGTPQGVNTSIYVYDSVDYNISESSSDFTLLLNWSGLTTVNQMVFRYKTVSGETHVATIYLWDYTASSWESYALLSNSEDAFIVKEIGIFDSANHITGGILQMKIETINGGGSTHKWQFDWITISKGAATPSGVETDPLSLHKSGDTPLTDNWNTGGYSFNMSSGNVTNVGINTFDDSGASCNACSTCICYNGTGILIH